MFEKTVERFGFDKVTTYKLFGITVYKKNEDMRAR